MNVQQVLLPGSSFSFSAFKFAKQVRHQPRLFSTEMKFKGRNSISAHNARQTIAALALCCANCILWYESLPFLYYSRSEGESYLQAQARVLALVAAKVLAADVEQSPHGGADAQDDPLLTAANAQDLAGALTAQAVIHLHEAGAATVARMRNQQRVC